MASNNIQIIKNGVQVQSDNSGSVVLDIQGTQGQLFSVTDSLVGDLFKVSDISGIPILTVNSSGLTYTDGDTNLGSGSLYVDSVNKRVGIGTTTPGNSELYIYDNLTGTLSAEVPITLYTFLKRDFTGTASTSNNYTAGYFKTSFYNSGTGAQTIQNVSAVDTDIAILRTSTGTITASIAAVYSTSNPYIGDGVRVTTFSNLYGTPLTNDGIITNYYDIYLPGIEPASIGTVTNKYGIYQADGTLKNFFSGSVGIGTNSPTRTLDVNGAIRTSNGQIFGGTGNVVSMYTDGSTAIRLRTGGLLVGSSYDTDPNVNEIRTSNNQNLSINARGTGILYLQTADTTKVTILNNGNVGIGTVTPNAKLDVNGNTLLTGSLTVTGSSSTITTTNGLSINRNASTYTVNLADTTRTSLIVSPNTSQEIALTITSGNGSAHINAVSSSFGATKSLILNPFGGNVGIGNGVVAPTYPLEVSGSIQSLNGSIFIYDNTNTVRGLSLYRNSALIGSIDTNNAQLTVRAATSKSIQFNANNNSTGAHLHIDTTGNIGVGTTTPAAKLHLSSSITGDGNFLTAGALIENLANPDGEATLSFRVSSSLSNYWMTGLNQSSQYKIAYGTSFADGNVKMVILDNGNVGLGVLDPDRSLEIQRTTSGVGGLKVSKTGATGDTVAFIGDGATASILGIMQLYSGSSEQVRLYAGGNSWINGGNVGIGTSSPTRKLQITSGDTSIDINQKLYLNGVNDNLWGVGLLTAPSGTQMLTAAAVTFDAYGAAANRGWMFRRSDTNTSLFEIQSSDGKTFFSGNVGIGTASPSTKFQINVSASNFVNSLVNATEPAFALKTYNSGSGTTNGVTFKQGLYYVDTENSSINFHRGSGGTDGFLSFNTSGTERVRINGAGNIGIGTTVPDSLLHIQDFNDIATPRAPIILSRYWASTSDTRASSIFHYVSSSVDKLAFAVSGDGGTQGKPNALSQIKMVVQANGNVGINTTIPSYPLQVAGNVSDISIYASNDIVAYSDQSVKTDLEIIPNALEKLFKINGYTFRRTDSPTNNRRAGVIAQEIEKVLPEVVVTNIDGTKAVAYGNITALLIQAIKEQQTQIQYLEEKIKKLTQ